MTRLIRIVAFLMTMFFAVWLVAQSQGVDILLSKARPLEARGRMDLAAQTWNQVLLVSPNQTEAIAGLARYAKQIRQADEERNHVDRLTKRNPKPPETRELERMSVG